jgi:hypothetical protein
VGKGMTCDSMSVLKELHTPYRTLFDGKKAPLSLENTYFISLWAAKNSLKG